ncbi:phosphatase PAP2 family protein [Rhodoferax sp.]|uniref:phosphatase PAP2 family protein n=1 Tax=Rhodoferax sp. TaxID=50421 RepID=UPI00374DDD34
MPYYLTKAPYWITRFGEIGIVLPIAMALTLWMLLSARSVRPVLGWVMALGLAVLVTTLSKIAFIGWGIGIPALDFTGFSGHAMFAAAIYPVLAYTLAAQWTPSRSATALVTLGGYALALLIAWSRVHIQVHSVSEVVAGFALGAAASGWSIWHMGGVPARPRSVRLRWALVGLVCWLTVMPLHAAPSRSHDIVTRIALELADRTQPFRRVDLHGYALPQT